MKAHYSKNHSNRRVQQSHKKYDYNKSKGLFNRFNTHQEWNRVQRLDEKNRQSQTVPPHFQNEVKTDSLQRDYHQSTSGTPLSNLVTTATSSTEPKYESDNTSVRTTRRLDAPPRSNEEWYIATGGIMPYRKPKDDNYLEGR